MPRTTFAAGRRRPTSRSAAAEVELGLERRDPRAHALDLGGKRSRPRAAEVVRKREHPLGEPVVLAQEIALPMLQVSELRRQCVRVRKPFDRHAPSIGRVRANVKRPVGGVLACVTSGGAGHDQLSRQEKGVYMGTDEAKGRIKEAAGDLTGDKDLKREGQTDQMIGNVKKRVDDAGDKVKDAVTSDDDKD